MKYSREVWSISGLAVALLLGAGACATDGTDPTPLVLTQAQADSLAEQVASDVEDQNAGATMTGLAGSGAAASFAGLAPVELVRCAPTKTPASPLDSDSDGVPDSVRIDFNTCVLNFFFETDTIRGTIDVLDPTRLVADHAVQLIFDDVTRVRVRTLSGAMTSETRNGTRSARRDATTLENSETNFRTDYVFRNGATATHVKTWNSTFTADVAGSIQAEQPLPSGTWTINGTSSWTRGTRTYSLTATTSPALHYNASCTALPRLDAGKVVLAVMRGGQSATVTIEFTACGEFTATRS